jgi:hypothetical protein
MKKRVAFMPLIYGIYFGMFVVMLALIIYAPVWAAVLGGLAIAFLGAIITDKLLQNTIVQSNPLMAVKEMGKSLVIAFVPPNRILLFPATKDLSRNSIRYRILTEGRWEEMEHYLTPEQEFQLEPKMDIKEKYTIWELLENPYVVWELKEPVKQVFTMEPYGIDAIVLVYPKEVITQEQLKVWNLQKVGDEKAVTEEVKDGKVVKKEIVIPVYSPAPYAISSDNIKQLSAHHRFSTIATVLEQTRDILRGAEAVAAGGIRRAGAGLAGILAAIRKNPAILIVLILLLGGLFFMWMLGGFVHLFQAKTQAAIAGAAQKAVEAGATKFP